MLADDYPPAHLDTIEPGIHHAPLIRFAWQLIVLAVHEPVFVEPSSGRLAPEGHIAVICLPPLMPNPKLAQSVLNFALLCLDQDNVHCVVVERRSLLDGCHQHNFLDVLFNVEEVVVAARRVRGR